MSGGLTTLISVLFGLAVFGALVTTIVSLRARSRREGSATAPRESAQETWRTAVPWIGRGALLIIVPPLAYALTR